MPIDELGLVAKLRKLVSLDDASNGGPYGGYAAQQCVAAMHEAAAAIERLLAERDDLRTAISTPEALHANMLRGGIPMLSIRQALHLHGADALATWDNAKAAESQRDKLKEVLSLCIGVLVLFTDPKSFSTSAKSAWAQAVAAETRARQALEDKP